MSLKPPIVPLDGTRFHASIRTMPNGEWRASCNVREGNGSTRETQTKAFPTEDEARSWIASVGTARGFRSMTWD